MEDVVLYYKSADAATKPEVNSLLAKTEGALKSFPCRVPPVFIPWFPSAGDRWLPIRPSKPAPILSLGQCLYRFKDVKLDCLPCSICQAIFILTIKYNSWRGFAPGE